MCALAQAGLKRQEFPLATLLVGPKGAGKWLPLCGWSWGEREARQAALYHKWPTLLFQNTSL